MATLFDLISKRDPHEVSKTVSLLKVQSTIKSILGEFPKMNKQITIAANEAEEKLKMFNKNTNDLEEIKRILNEAPRFKTVFWANKGSKPKTVCIRIAYAPGVYLSDHDQWSFFPKFFRMRIMKFSVQEIICNPGMHS